MDLLISKCHLGEVAQIPFVQTKHMQMMSCGQGCWAFVHFHDVHGNQWVLTPFQLSDLHKFPEFSVLAPIQNSGISLKIQRLYALSAHLISLPEKQNRLAVLSQRHMIIGDRRWLYTTQLYPQSYIQRSWTPTEQFPFTPAEVG